MLSVRIFTFLLVLSTVLAQASFNKVNSRSMRLMAHQKLSDRSALAARAVADEGQRQTEELQCYHDALDEMNEAWQNAVKGGSRQSFNEYSQANGGLPDPMNCLEECDDQ